MMTGMARGARIACLALLALGTSACNTLALIDGQQRVEGSGTVIEKAIDVGPFTRIDVGGAVTADVTVGPERAVTLRSDDNIVERMELVVEGGTLHVRTIRGSFNFQPTDGIVVTIHVPELEGVDASGAATVAVDRVSADGFSVDASGAAEVRIDRSTARSLRVNADGASEVSVAGGKAAELVADLSGAALLDVADLQAERVALDASGAAHGQVNASDDLEVTLSGGSSFCYAGEPGNVGSDVSGGASLEPCP